MDTRLVKCPICGEKLPKNEAIQHTNKRYYHENCFEEWKGKADDRTQLIDYVIELYEIDRPNGMMLKQIKEFQEEPHNYKLTGIKLALQYFHETLENPVREGGGIGIVPFIYEKAKDYYILKKGVEQSLKDFEKVEKRVIRIKQPGNNTPKKDNSIDMDSL